MVTRMGLQLVEVVLAAVAPLPLGALFLIAKAPRSQDATRDLRERTIVDAVRVAVLGANIKWGKWKNVDVKSDWRLVYIFLCEAGKKAASWEQSLAD